MATPVTDPVIPVAVPVAVTYAGTPVDVMVSTQKRKKSRVIPPDRRKKVAQACDTCKKRKQKCNGLRPCNLCSVKGIDCLYTAIDRRVLKPSKKQRLDDHDSVENISSKTNTPTLTSVSPVDNQDFSGTQSSPMKEAQQRQHLQSQQQPIRPQTQPQGQLRTKSLPTQQIQIQQLQPVTLSGGYHTSPSIQPPANTAPAHNFTQFPWSEQGANGHLMMSNPTLIRHPSQQQISQTQYSHQILNQQGYPAMAHQHLAPHPVSLALPAPVHDSSHYAPHQTHGGQSLINGVSNPLDHSTLSQVIGNQNSSRKDSTTNGKERQAQMENLHQRQRTSSTSPYPQHRDQIPASLQPLLSFPLNIHPSEVHDESYNEYMVTSGHDQNWRLLSDNAGNLRYLGESSGTAYLLQCRKVFQKLLGPQKFSDDLERFTFVDAPCIPLTQRSPKLPERTYTDYLVTTYLNNLNNVLYVLDDDSFIVLVDRVYSQIGQSNVSRRDYCILFLVLAIASVFSEAEISKNLFPFPQDYFTNPVVYFETAMSILNATAEDDNIWMAEAYLLIFFFYQFTGHKNTAWVKLGGSIRYAQGLGLNRKYVNESYKDPKFVMHRRKLFRSLFIMDTLSSVHLGRSMTIRLQDWDDIGAFDSFDDFQTRLLRVCELNSKILENVYFNPSVTLKMALNIAVDLKLFTLKNPIKPLSPENYPAPVDHKYLLPHVIYLHGIILLARPFFHFVVLKKLGLVHYDPDSKNLVHLNNFYHSCIKASLLIVKIVEYCYYQNIHPFKPMSLVSCTFHAGLVLGLLLLMRLKGIDHEMFKNDPNINVDPEAMLSHAMSSVIKVLVHYGRIDPQSKRYANILQNMLDVTKQLPERFDGDDSDASSDTAQERINTQQNFENILRFQDWLFPKADSLAPSYGGDQMGTGYEIPSDSNINDDFLKDIAGINNVDASGPQFLDDFLYNVIDANGGTRPSGALKNVQRMNNYQ